MATAMLSFVASVSTAFGQEPLPRDPADVNVTKVDLNELRQQLTEGFKQYETQLQAVLRTRYPEEQQFVGSIVYLVQKEKIPKNIVDSSWLWVRKNRPTTKYPFVYFERVLRLEAEKLKIEIPEFDRELYNRDRLTQGFQSGFRK